MANQGTKLTDKPVWSSLMSGVSPLWKWPHGDEELTVLSFLSAAKPSYKP